MSSIQTSSFHSLTRTISPRRQKLRSIPAYYLRGGTSKGVFMPGNALSGLSSDERREALLHLMGSPDAEYGRQLNGIGGGISSLSKIMVVSPAEPGDTAHVRYQFIQVGIKDSVLDESGNCGNLSAMVGAYALWTRMVDHHAVDMAQSEDGLGRTTVRALNMNTNKVVATTFPVIHVEGHLEPVLDLPETAMAGVPGKASRIVLDFLEPEGAATGKLLPSNSVIDTITMQDGHGKIRASLVDATNPTVFIQSDELRGLNGSLDFTSTRDLDTLEHIRREGALRMGLNPDTQAQPKICVLSGGHSQADIVTHTLSMGVLHKAIPMTVGLCLGVAAKTPNTIVEQIVGQTHAARLKGVGNVTDLVRIEHPGGSVEVGADVEESTGVRRVRSAKVSRTGKRLMSGEVWL
jgi:2-methylaconitate cis-trans-isomerase PrpF